MPRRNELTRAGIIATSTPRRVRPSPALALGVLIVLQLGACGGGGPDRVEPGVVRRASRVDTVDVALLEYAIGMPTHLAAGTTALRLSNQGFEMHNLKFFPSGADSPVWETSADVNPSETRVVFVDLVPGAYNVRCDVAGHDTRGMQINIEVEARSER